MKLEERLEEMLSILTKADRAISGSELSKKLGVSRQIIVQDITRLKNQGNNILSTPRGYVLDHEDEYNRIFKVYHTVEDTEKELNLIVDLGAEVRDVFIFHKVYGEIHANLGIRSRRDVKSFCDDIRAGKSFPLSTATAGYHYHTIVARDSETLDLVEKELKTQGFLAKLTAFEPDALEKQI